MNDKKDKYYTIGERKELLKDVFMSDEQQEKFREYNRYCQSFLGDKKELTAQDGFNHCLKMIREATDIDWEKVKWKGLDSSMVSWFSSLGRLNRNIIDE